MGRLSGPPVSYATTLRSDRPWDVSDGTVYGIRPITPTTRLRDEETGIANNIALGRYVLVLRAMEKSEPKVVAGGQFEPGEWSGWAVLFDYKTQTPLCQSQFQASSSDEAGDRVAHCRQRAIALPHESFRATPPLASGSGRNVTRWLRGRERRR
jgi:hypothetical protein